MLLENGQLNVQRLLGGNASGKKITQICVGTGSSPVVGTETSLTGEFSKNVTTVDYLGNGYFQFNTLLEAGDPAMLINEVGLKNESGVLVHRKIVSPTSKVAGTVLAIGYKIKVF